MHHFNDFIRDQQALHSEFGMVSADEERKRAGQKSVMAAIGKWSDTVGNQRSAQTEPSRS